MTDEELVRLCQSGQEAGFAGLFTRYQIKAWRLAYAITGDRDLADDVTQESFIQAFRRIGNVRPGAPFWPWFYALVANRSRRKVQRRRWLSWLPLTDAYHVDDPKTTGALRQIEESGEIWQAVAQLPTELRQVIALRFALDLSEADTAAVLGIPPGTVKSRMFRAKQLLHQRLSIPEEGGVPCR